MTGEYTVEEMQFLSTPSARRATCYNKLYITSENISIHALREEGDAAPRGPKSARNNFYPRPPRGGRRAKAKNANSIH